MVPAEKGGLNCLCHPPACQLDPHDKARCRTDHPTDRLLDWHSRVQILMNVLDKLLLLLLTAWR